MIDTGTRQASSARPLCDRLGDVGQQAVARRAQLAGPRAAALHVPLEVEPLGEQVAEVLAQATLVDLVVAEAAPDEDDAGPAWPAGRSARSGGCRRRPCGCGGSRVGEHARRAAAGRAYERWLGRKTSAWRRFSSPQPVQPGGVGLDVPGAGVQRAQLPDNRSTADRALDGDQARPGPPGPFAASGSGRPSRAASADARPRKAGPSLIASTTPRHLVAVAEPPFGALQRDHGRAPDVARERLRACGRAGLGLMAGPQLTEQGRLPGHDPAPAGLLAGDVLLPARTRPPGIGQQHEVGPAGAAIPVPGPREPYHPHRDHQGVVSPAQPGIEAAVGRDQHLGRRGGVRSFAAEPLGQQAALGVRRVHRQREPGRAAGVGGVGVGEDPGLLRQVASLAVCRADA